jgi:hypothetical protein
MTRVASMAKRQRLTEFLLQRFCAPRLCRAALCASQENGPPMSQMGVRRDKAALSSGCKSHPATAPAGSSRSSYGGDEIAEAFGMRVTNW